MENSLRSTFFRIYGERPEVVASAPGRINIMGEHTDYTKGFVLPAAIHLRNYFLASKRKDRKICLWAENFQERTSFSLGNLASLEKTSWTNYVRGIFGVLERTGCSLSGVNAVCAGNIPLDAGLSSSAAFEMSILFGLNCLLQLDFPLKELARMGQKVENEFVGVQSGMMDQFASLFGKKGMAISLDCQSFEFDLIPLCLAENGLEFIVYDSQKRRGLVASEYNKRRVEAFLALKFLRELGYKSFREISSSQIESVKKHMDKTLFKRAKHITSENERVLKAVEALQLRDFELLGTLLFESHKSLREEYEVSCSELDLLYEIGKEFSGCLGARLTGAGFGGSGIALIRVESFREFKKALLVQARKRNFPEPRFYEIEAGNGAKLH